MPEIKLVGSDTVAANSPKPPPTSLDELCSYCGNRLAADVANRNWCVICGRCATPME
jgi:hypothetical protein